MTETYNPQEIESRWQQRWIDEGTYEVDNDDPRPSYYVLSMYPYPSGPAHMGHVRNYTMGDLLVRYRTMRGDGVLSPIGFDSFGLPAENAAIKTGTHPRIHTEENIEKLSVNEILVTFLFIDDNFLTVMNNENFEQSSLDKTLLSGNKDFLSDGIQLTVEIIGDEIVNIKLPKSIKVEVKTADAVVKGQTASSSFKNATTTNDIKILVPPHIKEGDKIIINTE